MNYSIFILIFLALLPTIFWIIFFYLISKQKTTPANLTAIAFLLGITAVIAALLLERIVFYFLPKEYIGILFGGGELRALSQVVIIFSISFFVIALIEEFIKYEVLHTIVSRAKTCDQIIDFVKLGIAVGLGFATAENVYYFFAYHWDQFLTVAAVFVSRFFLTTLAHVFYGAVLGYYLGHTIRNPLNKKIFIRKGIIAAIIIHGLFNFMIFTNVAFYNVILVLVTLIILVKWLRDRRLFEIAINQEHSSSLYQPILFEPPEAKSFLSFKLISDQRKSFVLKKINFCPYCLNKLRKNAEVCWNCKKKVNFEL